MAVRIVQKMLYQEVAERLRGMIQAGELQAGEWINEPRLTAVLGISRTPLREALKVLVTEGLLRLEPRRGCFVNELSAEDLDDIFPLMALLEGRCAFEAARKITVLDIQRLDVLHRDLRRFAEQGAVDDYYAANAKIHVAIQALAANRWLSDLIDNLRQVLSLSRHRSLTYPGRVQESCAEHLAIFAALKAHDSEQAEAITRQHLMRQLDALRALARQAEHAPAHQPPAPGGAAAGDAP
ncbi:GntR family transcriptional regulator [Castellaniella caeni]|uniref:GntR family transcriptional regulator n=1 Tax=Castellaniella caeni TaxID=266123 RepID=UPI0009FEB4C0|nr:GntR family transcriptional regulator [Castellaniella caeni]